MNGIKKLVCGKRSCHLVPGHVSDHEFPRELLACREEIVNLGWVGTLLRLRTMIRNRHTHHTTNLDHLLALLPIASLSVSAIVFETKNVPA